MSSVHVESNSDRVVTAGGPEPSGGVKGNVSIESDFDAIANPDKKRAIPRPRPPSPDQDRHGGAPAPATVEPQTQEHIERPERRERPMESSESQGGDTREALARKKRQALYEYELKNKNGKFSTMKFDNSSDLQDILLEIDIIDNKRFMESNLSVGKKMLMMATTGIVWLNKTYDPFDVDMDDWGRQMFYDVNKGNFDDILLELVKKYLSNNTTWPPEMRLVMAFVMSFGATVLTKRQQKQLQQQMREQMKGDMEQRMRAEIAQEMRAEAAAMQARAARKQPRERVGEWDDPPKRPRPPPVSPPTPPQESQAPPDLKGPTFSPDEMLSVIETEFIDPPPEGEAVAPAEDATPDADVGATDPPSEPPSASVAKTAAVAAAAARRAPRKKKDTGTVLKLT